jgi:divalent metal cation (Fe/Co/Zn/Cd) transporter
MLPELRPAVGPLQRGALVRRGLWLNYFSLLYNALEAVIAIGAGVVAGSVALVGFGADSMIEVTASVAAQWRLRADIDASGRARVEFITVRIVGWCFLLLALYVAYDSTMSLAKQDRPDESVEGIALTVLSVIVMPVLAHAKRRVAVRVGSRALVAEARQTTLCAYLSAIVLAGLALNAIFGWWWADPVAALCMVPIIAKEGFDGLRGEPACNDCC